MIAVFPSAEIASRYGSENPLSVSTIVPDLVSITLTVPFVLLPAHTVLPSGATAIPSVRGPVGITRTNAFFPRSISETAPEPTSDVHARVPSRVRATMCEPCAFVGIAASTVPLSMFTSTMFCVASDVTTTRDSSPGRNMAPCGRVY